MIIIGEKINGSIPVVAKAIAEKDAEFIKQRAIAQDKAGATYIDCCASVEEDVEVETPIERCMTPMIAGRKLAVVPILRAGLGMVSGVKASW